MRNYWGIKPFDKKDNNYQTFSLFGTRRGISDYGKEKYHNPFRFGLTNPLPKNIDKDMTYTQARRQFGPSLSPFGDWDKDRRLNMFDCRPFNPLMHKVPEEHKERKVPSYFRPNTTWGELWSEAERDIPYAFKGRQSAEQKYSNMLSKSLMVREDTLMRANDLPFKDVVGLYTSKEYPSLSKVILDANQTKLAQYFLNKYLVCMYPDLYFEFNQEEPVIVTVMKAKTGEIVDKDAKVSKYIPKDASSHIKNLLTLMTPYTSVKLLITDYPLDVLKKSALVKEKEKSKQPGQFNSDSLIYTSCETIAREELGLNTYSYHEGAFSDVEHGNAIVWIYLGKNKPGEDAPNGRVMLRWGTTTGQWEDKKDIAIVYKHEDSDPNFYGMSGRSARAIIGELQKILKSKGYLSHTITSPYRFRGYCDVRRAGFSEGTRVTYEPFPVQKAETLPIPEYKKTVLARPRIPKALQFHFTAEGPQERRELSKRVMRESEHFEPQLEPDVLLRLSKDEDTDVRYNISRASFPLPEPVIRGLVKDTSSTIRRQAVRRPEAPVEERLSLMINDASFAMDILGQSSLKPSERKVLSNHKNEIIRSNFAQRKDLTPTEFEQLSNDNNVEVRLNLITYHPLSKRYYEKFCNDPSTDIRRKMAKLKGLIEYPELMKKLANDSASTVRFAVAARKHVPEEILLDMIWNNADSDTLDIIASRNDITKKLIDALLQKGDMRVKRRISLNKHIPYRLRNRLMMDLIRNNSFDDATLVEIVSSTKSTEIIQAIADYLSSHSALEVADALARKTNIPNSIKDEIFALLYSIGDSRVKEILMGNETVDKEVKSLIKNGLEAY